MRVLIVGCGYVGLPLGAELVRRGHEVSGIRRDTRVEPELAKAGIHPVSADITRPESLAGLRPEFDWVVNCVSSGGGDAGDYRRVYLDGTRHLLGWLSSSPPTRFVYTSSTSVYGQDDGSAVDEISPTEPGTETTRVLVETEAMLLQAVRERRFPAVILRVAGIYGPGRGYWLKRFVAGDARIEGDGTHFVNMVHRDDVVGAIIAALERGREGEIYNVVDDEPVTQLALVRWLAEATGRSMPAVESVAGGRAGRGATNKRVVNRKLKSDLGYALKYPEFRKGFVELIETNPLP